LSQIFDILFVNTQKTWLKIGKSIFCIFQLARNCLIVIVCLSSPKHILTCCKVFCTNLLHLDCKTFFSIFFLIFDLS
jgi:hypothetical protein